MWSDEGVTVQLLEELAAVMVAALAAVEVPLRRHLEWKFGSLYHCLLENIITTIPHTDDPLS